MTTITRKLSLLARRGTKRTIGDQEFTFYSISPSMLWELKCVMKPIAAALSAFFKGRDNDAHQIVEETYHPVAGNGQPQALATKVVQVMAVAPEIARFRADRSDKVTSDAVEAIFAPQNKESLARLLMSSLRDDYKGEPTADEVKEFLGSLDLELTKEFVAGFLAANARILGPFVERAMKTVREKLSAVITPPSSPNDLGEMESESASQSPSQTQTPGNS